MDEFIDVDEVCRAAAEAVGSRISFDHAVPHDDYTELVFFGGLNGRGRWSVYLADLGRLLADLEQRLDDAWVISTWSDVLDDVFEVRVGTRTMLPRVQ